MSRNFSSSAVAAHLTAPLGATETVALVSDVTGWPAAPCTLILDKDRAQEEVVTATAIVGLAVTIIRGEDGTAAVAHDVGAPVVHGASARDFRVPLQHSEATSGVHGVVGSLLGDTDAQTVQNKTFISVDGSAPGLVVKQGAATSGKVLDVRTAANTSVGGFDVSGKVIGSAGLINGTLDVSPTSPTAIPLNLTLPGGATADAVQIKLGSVVVFRIDKDGNTYAPNLQQGSLNATSINTNSLTTGTLNAGTTVLGATSATSVGASGTITGAQVTAASAVFNNSVQAGTLNVTGSLTYGGGKTIPRFAAGRSTVTITNSNVGSVVVNFPASRFSQVPVVTVTMTSAPANTGKHVLRALNATSGGMTVYAYTGDGSTVTGSVTFDWIALQMTDGSSTG